MPWVPQAVLAELIEASRLLREQMATPRPVSAPVVEPDTPRPATPAVMSAAIPPEVVEACERYAFGDPQERAANYHRARGMLDAGKRVPEIVKALREGGVMPVGFV